MPFQPTTAVGPFPLPRLPSAPGVGVSRSARQRGARRAEILTAANHAIEALNVMCGLSTPSGRAPSPAQASMHRHILSSVAAEKPRHMPHPSEALEAVLGHPRLEYSGSSSKVEPYSELRFSLSGCSNPIDVGSLLASETRDFLNASNLLEDERIRLQLEKDDPVAPYTDVVLRRSRAHRLNFLKRLVGAGILSCIESRIARVTPFFVYKGR